MKISILDNQVSISDQIEATDIARLAQEGVALVVCNRPDNEVAAQLSFEAIAQACRDQGLEAHHIPFVGDAIEPRHVEQFEVLLASGRKIHAYCRSGARSSKLWAATRFSEGEDPAGILETARRAGIDVARQLQVPRQASASGAGQYDVVVVGGGAGGIAVANSLLRRNGRLRLAIIEPAQEHYYQPGWTMVGAGVFKAVRTRRRMADLMPGRATWIQQAAAGFTPHMNQVTLDDGKIISYGHLVVAPGLKLDWGAVEGLPQTLGRNGVTSNYRYDLAPYTWELVKGLHSGRALFTQPPMPIKCAGAPQKAMYLSSDYWLKSGVLGNIEVNFYNAGAVLFGVEAYVPALQSYVEKYSAHLHFGHNLVRVDGPARRAWFRYKDADGVERITESEFDMIHVCPPQCAPDFVRRSDLADAAGWLDVDQYTLRHKRHGNIWGLGDATNTPNAKTMAAVRKQVPVVAQNIVDCMGGGSPTRGYDGYGSCPLTVERGKIVLAEFGYGGKLIPTFPEWVLQGRKPTRAAWMLKTHILPEVYWHGMLQGREWLVAPRKLESVTP